MHPVIEEALKDWRIMNGSQSWWARFESFITPGGQVIVRLEYGVKHHDGFVESTLNTKIAHYFLDSDNKVRIDTDGSKSIR